MRDEVGAARFTDGVALRLCWLLRHGGTEHGQNEQACEPRNPNESRH
jgi:hypothetical protein